MRAGCCDAGRWRVAGDDRTRGPVERRRLTAAFKALTLAPARGLWPAYGDPIGPTIETLRVRAKSWNDIIDSAIRPGSRPSFDGVD